MTFDSQKILQSKREFHRGLAGLPIEDKLRLLDALRERQLALGPDVERRPVIMGWPDRTVQRATIN